MNFPWDHCRHPTCWAQWVLDAHKAEGRGRSLCDTKELVQGRLQTGRCILGAPEAQSPLGGGFTPGRILCRIRLSWALPKIKWCGEEQEENNLSGSLWKGYLNKLKNSKEHAHSTPASSPLPGWSAWPRGLPGPIPPHSPVFIFLMLTRICNALLYS